jgi:hypothetical protein
VSAKLNYVLFIVLFSVSSLLHLKTGIPNVTVQFLEIMFRFKKVSLSNSAIVLFSCFSQHFCTHFSTLHTRFTHLIFLDFITLIITEV